MTNLAASLVVVALVGAGVVAASTSRAEDRKSERKDRVELGNFSVSLAVKDIAASRDFYEKLGFASVMGDASKRWLILQNGSATIGLFQGLLERNTLTFNPGWTSDAKPLDAFQDIRDIQRALKERGLSPKPEADEASRGPASLRVVDPDGNPVLIDQHVARPGK